jgi:hypothetical protein
MYMEGRRNKDGNGTDHSGLGLRAFHAVTKVQIFSSIDDQSETDSRR